MNTRKTRSTGTILAGMLAATAAVSVSFASAGDAAPDAIPYERFTLDNGLRVIVHEDRKAPIVAISVWYQVGSKDEPPGKTGFAHLFEHLMFRGSENFSGDFFETLQNVGASTVNGTTSFDRTNYFATVPTPAVELVLWLESDRMGHLLGAVTQQALDDERGIVKNEKRQREGMPYAMADARIREQLYPKGHPYHHPTIGSMADLDAASLEDVHAWFKKYYGAANAIVVLAGDIEPGTARSLVEKYFGDIAAGPPLHRMTSWVPERIHNTREQMFDNVAQTAIRRAWATPGAATKDRVLLDVVAFVLGGGKNSRLYDELVEKRKLATNVRASVAAAELGSFFDLTVFVRSGVDSAEVETALDEIVKEFLDKGPDAKELGMSKIGLESFAVRSLESVTTKAQLLAQGALYGNDPGFIDKELAWTREASRTDVRRVARKWLSKGYHQLIVYPFGSHSPADSQIDRSQMPGAEGDIVLDLPEMQEAELSNGIKVVLAQRPDAATVEMIMRFKTAGSNADWASGQNAKPMTAETTFRLMGDGPRSLGSSSDYTEQKERLGLQIGLWAGRESGWSNLSALSKNLTASLELWADVLLDPGFREDDMELLREQALQALKHGKTNPGAVGGRILTYTAYGPDHPYTTVWNREEILESLEVADLKAFHSTRLSPGGATIFVVGDMSLAEAVSRLEKAFGDWKTPKGSRKASMEVEDVPVRNRPLVILVDRPNAQQTYISAGRLVPSDMDEDALALDAANHALGGGLSARIGSNLRVRRGWSYGAGSHAGEALAQRLWRVTAAVQSDKTAESVLEIINEMQALTGDRPVTAEELSLFLKSQTLSLPGRFESAIALLRSMAENAERGWAYDRAETLADRLDALQLADVNEVARKYFRPENLTWVLEGDISQFEQKIREQNIGEVEIWNTEGRRIR